jgi:hypothetical protein
MAKAGTYGQDPRLPPLVTVSSNLLERRVEAGLGVVALDLLGLLRGGRRGRGGQRRKEGRELVHGEGGVWTELELRNV